MKSSTVWHGHSTRPSLPAGTVRKASGHLSGRGPSILLTQDRSVAQKPHWGFCCCANASLPMAGGTGSSCKQRKTGSSHWGTPCCTYRYRLWLLAGCVRVDAPCFCFIVVGCTSKRIYRFFFSLAASWLVLRCSTIWANHSTIAGSS